MTPATFPVSSAGPMRFRTLMKLYGISILVEIGVVLFLYLSQGGLGQVATAIDPATTTGTITAVGDGRVGFQYVVGTQTFKRDGGLLVTNEPSNAPLQVGAPIRVDYRRAHPGFSCACTVRGKSVAPLRLFDVVIGTAMVLLISVGFVTVVAFGLEQWRKALTPPA